MENEFSIHFLITISDSILSGIDFVRECQFKIALELGDK